MFFLPVNIWGVLFSTISSVVIGFLWYSPILFGTQWKKLTNGSSKKTTKPSNYIVYRYSANFLATFVMMYVFAQVIGLTLMTTTFEGAVMGAIIWLGFVATAMVNMVLFENKSWALFFINSCYYLACLVVSGVILTIWI